MNDLPRQKLCEIIAYRDAITAKTGRDVLNASRLCKAFLLDLCGEHKREISVEVETTMNQILEPKQTVQTETTGLPCTVERVLHFRLFCLTFAPRAA